jgi:FlgN protein.
MEEKQVVEGALALEKVLADQTGLIDSLLSCVQQQEGALINNDLSGLRHTLEQEEEISSRMADAEHDREEAVEHLARALHLESPAPTLEKIVASFPADSMADRLRCAGKKLNASVYELQKKNATVQQLLTVKRDYADWMLRILTGNTGESKSLGYDSRGEMAESHGEERGIYEVLI